MVNILMCFRTCFKYDCIYLSSVSLMVADEKQASVVFSNEFLCIAKSRRPMACIRPI